MSRGWTPSLGASSSCLPRVRSDSQDRLPGAATPRLEGLSTRLSPGPAEPRAWQCKKRWEVTPALPLCPPAPSSPLRPSKGQLSAGAFGGERTLLPQECRCQPGLPRVRSRARGFEPAGIKPAVNSGFNQCCGSGRLPLPPQVMAQPRVPCRGVRLGSGFTAGPGKWGRGV